MLDQIREFHGQLVEYYDRLSSKTEQQRVKMLLEHMSRHERELEESLAAYEESAEDSVMDTYVECAYSDQIMAACERTPVVPETDLEGVIKLAMDIDNCLLQFYREVAEHADTEKVREVFRSLIELEETELRRLAMAALQVTDI